MARLFAPTAFRPPAVPWCQVVEATSRRSYASGVLPGLLWDVHPSSSAMAPVAGTGWGGDPDALWVRYSTESVRLCSRWIARPLRSNENETKTHLPCRLPQDERSMAGASFDTRDTQVKEPRITSGRGVDVIDQHITQTLSCSSHQRVERGSSTGPDGCAPSRIRRC